MTVAEETAEAPVKTPRNDWVNLSSDMSTYKIDDAIREKWQRSFGGDFWHLIYPIMTLVRPKGGARWEHWMQQFELARAESTELDRRAALFTLINEYCEALIDETAQKTVIDRLMSLPEWGPYVEPSTIDITEPRHEVPTMETAPEREEREFVEMLERAAEIEAEAVDVEEVDEYENARNEWWKD